ncbi:MAG TPA: ABC transporter permease subunit [Candidatus Paceibacterota bacterium]|nr:ABC transporter permease subunit [Candidatus Paceibacterota bacterium]
MKTREHELHHRRQKAHIRYPVSMGQKFYSIFALPILTVVVMLVVLSIVSTIHPVLISSLSIPTLMYATLATVGRLAIAYVLAVIFAIPLAILATHTKFFQVTLLPLFDVLQSVPILVLFPVIILVFIRFGNLNGAAIFILFISMLWSIVFTVVGGIQIIPKDITYAAQIFGIKKFDYVRKVILPAIVPELVTGSILSVGAGWNLIIIAEVLHTYIPGGTSAQDLFGIGDILVSAAAHGQNELFLVATAIMVVVIALFNFFVWQKLLHYAQRFKFD